MKSFTAGLAMRSKRPETFLINQLPRRSSESQPDTAGTFGHFSMPRMTISSMARVCRIAHLQYSGGRFARAKLCYAFEGMAVGRAGAAPIDSRVREFPLAQGGVRAVCARGD